MTAGRKDGYCQTFDKTRQKKKNSMMKFGVCGDVARARVAAKAGYDYWECSVMNALRPLEADAVF